MSLHGGSILNRKDKTVKHTEKNASKEIISFKRSYYFFNFQLTFQPHKFTVPLKSENKWKKKAKNTRI